MKHIKTFEHTLKHTDERSINHPLREFSEKFEDVIIAYAKEINGPDHYYYRVRRYFVENGDISIKIIDSLDSIFKIKLKIDNQDYVNIDVTFSTYKYNIISDFIDFFRDVTKEYNVYDKPYRIVLNFNKSKLDKVLKDIENYYIHIDSKKFNI